MELNHDYITSCNEPKQNQQLLKILLWDGLVCYLFKASQMGHFVMVSLWGTSLSINTRFRFLYFRMNNR